ncbi:MAG TPA: lysophospholipid acyltransferase family protein [Thermoanaerobaculia bacterium]|jgi:1-acyl-sn-glycerol-3-phosphate acyltransferase|nr:lysophospholipid acyltransferase family protein [Thermoanaerobaculia bacterium]
MRPRPDRVAAFSRWLLGVFFRSVDVAGAERIPRDRPLLVVANHVNGLIDPALILGPLPVYPRFLGKNTLWKIPLLRPFLALAGVIPVIRQQDVEGGEADPGSRRSANDEAFTKAYELLAEGGAIGLFPEGKSHNEPDLQPLKTGAARILLEAERRTPGLGVRIVPVGLHFDRKHKFRSRAFVLVGEAVDPATEVAAYLAAGGASREAVDALTERIDEALRSVTLSLSSWDEARLIARAAEVWARPGPQDAPRNRPLDEAVPLRRAFASGYRELSAREPERVAAVAEDVRRYDRLLSVCRLSDAQVATDYPASPALRFVAGSLGRLLLHLPLAAVGTLLNAVPYRVVGAIAHRAGRKAEDMEATFKLFGSMVLYPFFWGVEAALAGWVWGGWSALAVAIAAPVAGWSALRFFEGGSRFLSEARAFLVLRTRRNLKRELRVRRAEVVRGLEDLAARIETGEGQSPTGEML